MTLFPRVADNCHLNRCLGVFNRNLQDGYKPFAFVLRTLGMTPAVGAFCFWMTVQIENFHDAFQTV